MAASFTETIKDRVETNVEKGLKTSLVLSPAAKNKPSGTMICRLEDHDRY